MNRGVLERLHVDQMMAGSSNWWNINNMRPPSQQGSSFMVPSPANLFPQYQIPPAQSVSSSLDDNHGQLHQSWTQLLMGGMISDEKQKSSSNEVQTTYRKRMQNWEEQLLQHPPSDRSTMSTADAKQENSARGGYDTYGHENGEFSCVQRSWSAQMMPVSSPTSSVTSLISSNNMLDFSGNKSDGRHPPPNRSSECNSKATCGVQKKARVQPSSTQLKERKEKLGDRVTALHQIVSPFGKTDTASVLLEAIGYIRFLQGQIQALSLPYLANKSGNVGQRQHVHGERNCLFPEDPGQLLNDGCKKRKGTVLEKDSQEEQNKDLKSRGLCLVPISCTQQVGSDINAADYWPPALGGGGGGASGGFR